MYIYIFKTSYVANNEQEVRNCVIATNSARISLYLQYPTLAYTHDKLCCVNDVRRVNKKKIELVYSGH